MPSSVDAVAAVRDDPAEDLADLYENAPCGYLSIRNDGRIFKVNATFAAWTGFPSLELTGKRLSDLLTTPGRVFHETHFAPLLRMQGFFNEVAFDFITREGQRLPALVNAVEKRDAGGRPLFTRVTVFNATDRRRYERDLLEARAAAEAARDKLREINETVRASLLDERETAMLREQFIAVLGHDLRNPLGAIDSGLTLLRKMPLDERALALTGMMRDSVSRMAALIEDILDFARGRLGGGLTLNRDAREPLEPVLRAVIAELQASAPERKVETDFLLTRPVHCDQGRIAQLVSNLLGNALTYGAVDQPVRVEAITETEHFTLSIANKGEPIPPNALEHLFQPFYRGTVRPSRQGLGLGLYIAHEIATAHGGTLTVTSTPEETRFTLRMPNG